MTLHKQCTNDHVLIHKNLIFFCREVFHKICEENYQGSETLIYSDDEFFDEDEDDDDNMNSKNNSSQFLTIPAVHHHKPLINN